MMMMMMMMMLCPCFRHASTAHSNLLLQQTYCCRREPATAPAPADADADCLRYKIVANGYSRCDSAEPMRISQSSSLDIKR